MVSPGIRDKTKNGVIISNLLKHTSSDNEWEPGALSSEELHITARNSALRLRLHHLLVT